MASRPILMRTALASITLVALAMVAGCGTDDADSARDPAGPSAAEPESRPTEVPAAPGEVRSRDLALVMDDGKGPVELCLGPVAESFPPMCGGPEILGWDWADQRGGSHAQGDTRWGEFAVTGTWDGRSFTVSSAIPEALYDGAPTEESTAPDPREDLSEAELATVAREVGDLPGARGAYVDGDRVQVDVLYDDGSIQDWVDGEYGDRVVGVTSMLVDVD